MTRVLIVDDQELLRRGLLLVLRATQRIDVVAEAKSGEEALALLRTMSDAGELPDVVLSDYQMPGLSGLDVVARCERDFPGLPVVVLTTFADDGIVADAVDAGAAGFLLKDISPEALADAIERAASGDVVLDPRVARAALRRRPPTASDPLAELTPAERLVAEQLAQGHSNKEIALTLHLADGTVRNHVSSLLRKLQHRDRTALAIFLRDHLKPSTD